MVGGGGGVDVTVACCILSDKQSSEAVSIVSSIHKREGSTQRGNDHTGMPVHLKNKPGNC